MAVIIKDMEKLPDSCFNCDLHNYHFCNLTGNCIEENWDNGTRADDCPLEEVDRVVAKEQILPDDCEILTKEAYSDLCLRASKEQEDDNT